MKCMPSYEINNSSNNGNEEEGTETSVCRGTIVAYEIFPLIFISNDNSINSKTSSSSATVENNINNSPPRNSTNSRSQRSSTGSSASMLVMTIMC